MKSQSLAYVFSSIWEWCRSFTGMLTILVIVLATGIIALTIISEYYPKTSLQYRLTRIVFITGYIIFGINFASSLIAHLWATKWLMTALVILTTLLFIRAAFKHDNVLFVWIAATVFGFGLSRFTNIGENFAYYIYAVPILVHLKVIELETKDEEKNNSPKTQTKTGTPATRPFPQYRIIWRRTQQLTQPTATASNPGDAIINNIIQKSDHALQKIN